MLSLTIMKGPEFELKSYFGGRAYCLLNAAENRSIWVLDGDAIEFRARLADIEECWPNDDNDNILRRLWFAFEVGAKETTIQ